MGIFVDVVDSVVVISVESVVGDCDVEIVLVAVDVEVVVDIEVVVDVEAIVDVEVVVYAEVLVEVDVVVDVEVVVDVVIKSSNLKKIIYLHSYEHCF